MFAQKTFWIQCKSSRSYESMDEEEHAAMVSIMRNLSRFCGITVLTYSIESGNLSMLVSCPAREHHMEYFQDGENEPTGSGMERLFQHLRKLYTSSHVEGLAAEYQSLTQRGEDAQTFWERCTRRIGTPRKFAEGINEAFARWVKKNRPQLYETLDGNVCRKEITQVYLDQLQKQRDVACRMDQDAVLHDDGSEPRKYWCGFADALRGDEDALDGLRELMRSAAANAPEIKELGYCSQLVANTLRKETHTARPEKKPSRSTSKRGKRTVNQTIDNLAEHIAPQASAPPKPMSHKMKLRLMSTAILLLLIATGAGTMYAMKEWRKYEANTNALELANSAPNTENIANGESQPQQELEIAQTKLDTKKQQLAEITARLYDTEARQLADDFAKSTNPQIRLRMCRYPDQVSKRLDSYPERALSEAATEVTFIDVVNLGGIMAARFVAKFVDNSSRLICIVSTEDGLRVDWDCYARHNAKAVPLLLEGKTRSAELRIFARKSHYYNFTYRDDKRWTAFELSSPDFKDIIYAYSLKETTTGKLLDAAFKNAALEKSVQLTLQVSSNQDTHKRKQFNIDRIYAFGWVRAEKDIEDIYRANVDTIGGQATNK